MVLEDLPFASARGYLFSKPGGWPIHNTAMLERLRSLGIDATVHGFRSTFRDWCAATGVRFDVAELQLQHKIGQGDATVGAYYRTTLLDERREVLQGWAGFLSGDS